MSTARPKHSVNAAAPRLPEKLILRNEANPEIGHSLAMGTALLAGQSRLPENSISQNEADPKIGQCASRRAEPRQLRVDMSSTPRNRRILLAHTRPEYRDCRQPRPR